MNKTILITGATDGIGLATAKSLAAQGHTLIIHGRSKEKLEATKEQLLELDRAARIETIAADLSLMCEVETLATAINARQKPLDILINNAGVFVVPEKLSAEGLDLRFAVNTLAPYLLTKRLLSLLGSAGRVINVSSAAQAPLEPEELGRPSTLSDSNVYAKSKLAITMWTKHMADTLGDKGPVIVAVNPASFLGSKMVKQAYGQVGGDLQRGADVLIKAALSEAFAKASGLYFDNDIGEFALPHPDGLDEKKNRELVNQIEKILA